MFVRPLMEDPSNWEIFLGDLDGGEPVRLTFHDGFDGFPSISPDGTKMAFASNRDGDSEIYVINVDGSGVIQLTANSTFDGWPAWAP